MEISASLHRPGERINERWLLSSACMDEVREALRSARKRGHKKYFACLLEVEASPKRMHSVCITWMQCKNIWHWLNEAFCCCYGVKPQHVTDKNYPPTVNITGWMSLLNAPDTSPKGFQCYILYMIQQVLGYSDFTDLIQQEFLGKPNKMPQNVTLTSVVIQERLCWWTTEIALAGRRNCWLWVH